MAYYSYVGNTLNQEPMSRPVPRSIQLNAREFDFERFQHLPYMDISSSGETPFVVDAHICETSATYCVSTRTQRVLPFRPLDANSRIVNITVVTTYIHKVVSMVQGSTMESDEEIA